MEKWDDISQSWFIEYHKLFRYIRKMALIIHSNVIVQPSIQGLS